MQAGPRFGVRHPLAESGTAQDLAGASLASATVALDGLAAVLHLGREGSPLRVVEGRLHYPVEGALVALESQHVVGAARPQGLHDGGLAAGGIDRDHGSLQHHAREQAGEGRDLVALGPTRLLDQGQPLPHQESAHEVQGAEAGGQVARAAGHLAVQGQDQLPQAGQAGPVQQPEGGLHSCLRVQSPDQPQVGVAGRGGFAQGQPQPEPGLVVAYEGGHRGNAVGASGQGHQQGVQALGVVACDNGLHEAYRVSLEVVRHPIGRTAALIAALAATGNRSLKRIVCAGLLSINDGFVPAPSLTTHTPNQPFTDPFHPRPENLRLPCSHPWLLIKINESETVPPVAELELPVSDLVN